FVTVDGTLRLSPTACKINGKERLNSGLLPPGGEPGMTTPTPEPKRGQDEEAQRFIETLEKTGQLADVSENEDTSKLTARINHVRYPDGTIKRIRFTQSKYH